MYYLGSLQTKGMIKIVKGINSYNRYKPAPLGLSMINDVSESFDRCLHDGFQKYKVVL